jgi:hypothetical protein
MNLVSSFRCHSPPINPVYVRRVDPLDLAFLFPTDNHVLVFFIDLVLSI